MKNLITKPQYARKHSISIQSINKRIRNKTLYSEKKLVHDDISLDEQNKYRIKIKDGWLTPTQYAIARNIPLSTVYAYVKKNAVESFKTHINNNANSTLINPSDEFFARRADKTVLQYAKFRNISQEWTRTLIKKGKLKSGKRISKDGKYITHILRN